MIPQETIARIIESSDIVSIISEHVKLDKRGVNFIGCCPFHSEKTPSFTVSPAKQIFKCFGCGKSGNVVKFIEEIDSLPWIEAIKTLAEKAKIDLPKRELTPEEKLSLDARERLFIVNTFASNTWQQNFEASPGRAYMIERGFDDADFTAFGIGYAPESWDFLTNASRKASHKPETLTEAGLLTRKDTGHYFDRYRDRVIFPIHNLHGKIAGFTGRIINPNDNSSKYMNSPEMAVYHKSEILYGLFQAKNEIIKAGRCNLVEGNTDVMRWHKCGVKNTVGTCGTSLTAKHAKLIHRFTDNLTIVFDGDLAGIKAAFRGIETCLAEGLNVYVASLPDGEDPDSFARNKTQHELESWIESNEQDFIMFRANMAAAEMQNRPAEKARIMNELREAITKVPDAVTRELYIKEVSRIFDVETKTLAAGIITENSDIFGIEANAEAIRKEDEVNIYIEKEMCMEAIADGKENTIAIPGFPLRPEHIGAIELLTKNLVFNIQLPDKFSLDDEPHYIRDCKKLLERGFRITVCPPDSMNYSAKTVSFVEIYFRLLHNNVEDFDTDSQKIAIERSAEFLSKQDKTIISIKTGEIAKMFGITKAAFEQVLKPYINKQKSKATISYEAITVDDERFIFDDVDRLPDYVDRNFMNKFRHFPVQDKKGLKIFYMFQGDNSQMFRVANFYMEPQFQVRHEDPNKNKRIVKLNHSELKTSKYVEVLSDHMVEFGAFKKFVWRQGPYSVRNMKPQHLDMILDSIALDFPVCDELEIYGQQEEGFYAFCNAIFSDGKIEYMNDLGLVSYKGNTYYSPSVSCIYKDLRKDSDKYAQDRFFIFRETSLIKIHDWAELMINVYKYNDNGHWAVLMSILAAFRSDIFQVDRLFTTLFLYGPTGCGKSELAQSIRAIFMHPDAPMFNLNSGTDAAFFTTLERYRDAIVIMEEYNDMQISDIKFQGLKAAVYDGEGKTKRKDATSKDLDQSKVNAVPLILGQESPERDDASLANRAVLRPVKKVEYWSEEETTNFQKLKDYEKKGLTNILIEILKQRDTVRKYYTKKLRSVHKELRDDMRQSHQSFDTRVLNTVTLFAAMVKLIDEHVTDFKLPFNYQTFYPLARKVLIEQSESIHQTNRLAVFFDTLLLLSEDQSQRGLIKGKEYKIEAHDTIEVRRGRKDAEIVDFEGKRTKLLFLRLDMIHPKYKAQVGINEHLKMNNLLTYIRDHPAYVGQIKMTRFVWHNETRIDDGTGKVVSVMKEESKRTSATVLNYEIIREIIDLGDETDFVAKSNYTGENTNETENSTSTDEAIEAAMPTEGIQRGLPF